MKENLYKVAVVATMSSGKSTFINSLLGKEILASGNTACTGSIIEIFNENNYKYFNARIKDKKNKFDIVHINDSSYIKKLNNDELNEIIITGKFFNIKNDRKKLVLVDTPGVNNSLDSIHAKKTYDYLRAFNAGMIIYVINATQFGISDDKKFLTYISEKINNNKNIKIVFLINKIDEIDDEEESISNFVENVRVYIQSFGIINFEMVPASTLSGLLFRRVLNNDGVGFTRKEKRVFCNQLEFWKNESVSKRKFSILTNQNCKDQKIFLQDKKYDRCDIEKAIHNTGITTIEEIILEQLCKSY